MMLLLLLLLLYDLFLLFMVLSISFSLDSLCEWHNIFFFDLCTLPMVALPSFILHHVPDLDFLKSKIV